MRRIDTRGHFWVPAAPDLRCPGRLVFDGRATELVLDEALADPTDRPEDGVLPVVWGVCGEGDVSLLSGRSNVTSRFGSGEETILGGSLYIGGHIDGDSRVDLIEIGIDGLDSLVAGWLTDAQSQSLLDLYDHGLETVAAFPGPGSTLRIVRCGYGRVADAVIDVRRETFVAVELAVGAALSSVVDVAQGPLECVTAAAQIDTRLVSLRARLVDADRPGDRVGLVFHQRGGLPDGELGDTAAVACPLVQQRGAPDDLARLLGTWSHTRFAKVAGALWGTRSRTDVLMEWRIVSAAIAVEETFRLLTNKNDRREVAGNTGGDRLKRVRAVLDAGDLPPDTVDWAMSVLSSSNGASFRNQVMFCVDRAGPVGAALAEVVPDLDRRLNIQRRPAAHAGNRIAHEEAHHLAVSIRILVSAALLLDSGAEPDWMTLYINQNTEFRSTINYWKRSSQPADS